MKKTRQSSGGLSIGSSFGGVIAFLAMAGVFAFVFYWAQNRIHQVHRDLFNADAPITYDIDFGNLEIIAKTRINSVPRADSKFKELPFMSHSQAFRVTHKIGFGSHHGTVELKVSDNGQDAEYLSSDIVINFVAGISDVAITAPSFKYDAPGFSLLFGDINGSVTHSGHLKFRVKTLDVKMVNYLFKLSDINIDVPQNQKSINLLASKIQFDEVTLDHSKIDFMGTNPFEVTLDSSFKSQPVEIAWNIQKTSVLNQDVEIGSGKMKFPVALLDAFIEPKVDMQLYAQEKEAHNSGGSKVRFLFSAAKDVKMSEAKATTLRALASSKNLKREGDFYHIRIDKQDAFKIVEEKTQKAQERKNFLDSWKVLDKDKMLEEAYYGLIFGDENRALAVKELIALKSAELKSDPLFNAVKVRLELRNALVNIDEYNPDLLEKVARKIPDAVTQLGEHKFGILLRLALAKARGDKALSFQLYDEFKTKEPNLQIQAMFEFMKFLHIDNVKALQSLEKARELDPKSLYVQNFLRNRIHVYQHMGEKEKLEADLRLVMDSNPSPEDLVAYSDLLEEKKDLVTSLQIIERCTDQNPVHKACNEQRESVMTQIATEKQKENPDEAIVYLQNLLLDRPASVMANEGIANLYKLKSDKEKSIHHYSIACALGNSASCIEAGDSLALQGANERAALLYDISCDLKSGNGCLKAGLVFDKSKDLVKSGEYFELSCNQFQDNVGCYHLARNLQKKQAPNRTIAPYLTKACKAYGTACKLATVYGTTNMQPDIPDEPE